MRYIREARAAGLRTAVVSSSKHCGEMLGSAGIGELFDGCIDGAFADAGQLAGKPAPTPTSRPREAVGVDPEEAVVFEDELAGVEAGRAGHFGYVVGVDRVGRPPSCAVTAPTSWSPICRRCSPREPGSIAGCVRSS